MDHYICPGTCKGLSEMSTKCADKTCPFYGRDFEPCDCLDDKHHGRQNQNNPPGPLTA